MSYFHEGAGRSVERVGRRRSSHRFFFLLAIALLTPLALLYAQTVYKGSKASSSSKAAATTTLSNVYVTLYGWPDNSPAGNAIAYPKNGGYPTIHNVATAGQTYSNPGTFATDALSGGEMAVGTIVYDPRFQKYFVLEDECSGSGPDPGNCEYDWKKNKKYHIDLWLGGNPPANDNDVANCEDSLTFDGETIIENPPSNETVNTKSLFNSNTNTCW